MNFLELARRRHTGTIRRQPSRPKTGSSNADTKNLSKKICTRPEIEPRPPSKPPLHIPPPVVLPVTTSSRPCAQVSDRKPSRLLSDAPNTAKLPYNTSIKSPRQKHDEPRVASGGELVHREGTLPYIVPTTSLDILKRWITVKFQRPTHIPLGLVLQGEIGTGKTSLLNRCAQELGIEVVTFSHHDLTIQRNVNDNVMSAILARGFRKRIVVFDDLPAMYGKKSMAVIENILMGILNLPKRRTRKVERPTQTKPHYPLIFTSSPNYRHCIPKYSTYLKCVALQPPPCDAIFNAIANHLRRYTTTAPGPRIMSIVQSLYPNISAMEQYIRFWFDSEKLPSVPRTRVSIDIDPTRMSPNALLKSLCRDTTLEHVQKVSQYTPDLLAYVHENVLHHATDIHDIAIALDAIGDVNVYQQHSTPLSNYYIQSLVRKSKCFDYNIVFPRFPRYRIPKDLLALSCLIRRCRPLDIIDEVNLFPAFSTLATNAISADSHYFEFSHGAYVYSYSNDYHIPPSQVHGMHRRFQSLKMR